MCALVPALSWAMRDKCPSLHSANYPCTALLCRNKVRTTRRGSSAPPTMGKEEVERDGEGGKRGRSRDHSRRGDQGRHRADRCRSEARGKRGPFYAARKTAPIGSRMGECQHPIERLRI